MYNPDDIQNVVNFDSTLKSRLVQVIVDIIGIIIAFVIYICIFQIKTTLFKLKIKTN